MKIQTTIALLGVLAAAGCKAQPYHYPHDVSNSNIPHLYLNGSSYGHKITIKADDKIVWDGIVPSNGVGPNIHAVGIPRSKQKQCTISIVGEPYDASLFVDWAKGNAVIITFEKSSTTLIQKNEPIRFL
jgi:hypothetical protein